MATRIQVRRDLAANWTGSLVLASGEIAYETNTGNVKIGDGTTTWANLDYIAIANRSSAATDIDDTTFRVMGRFYLNTTTGSWTNLPTDMTAADGNSLLLVTRHMDGANAWFYQHLIQFVTSGSDTKEWVRAYSAASSLWSAWKSTAHLEPNEVVTASINDSAVTTSKIADSTSTTTGVTNDKLRHSAALSVIGRTANSVGAPADIAAGTDGHVLRRSGTAIGFGTIASAGIANGAVTSAKLENNISIAGTLGVGSTLSVTGTTTFTGAPSYAADPASGNVLSRKTYVDDRTRIGAFAVVVVQNNAIVGQSTTGQFSIVSNSLRGPAAQTWYAALTYFNGTTVTFQGNVTNTSGVSTSFGNANAYTYVLVRTA